MSYEGFRQEILGWIGESGITSKVFFNLNEEKKRYEARIPEENCTFSAPCGGFSITVRFGSGHQSMVPASSQ